jgi:predicted MFS family arabinose efflux permease
MRTRHVLLLATVCGVTVGNVYFPQSVSPAIAAGLGVSPGSAAAVVSATQFGYTAGLFLLVPLGDRLPHRRLLGTLLTLTGLLLLSAGAAPALIPLVALSLMIGFSTVVAPIIGPMVAGLVPAGRRGLTSGLLLSGSTGGMLLSRTFSGYLAAWWGWRAPYVLAGILVLLLAAVSARILPATTPATRQRYPALLAEPMRLLRREPELRRSCLYQATIFAAFSAVWTCVALLLTGPAYGYDARAVGLLALVNAATMIAVPLTGRQVDRHGPDVVNLICVTSVIIAAGLLALGGTRLPWLIAGTLVLDVAMQSGMVANQVRIYALDAAARSRLNTAYMTCAYLGGAVGSWVGLQTYARFGWLGVCTQAALLAAVPLVRLLPAVRAASVTENPAGVSEPAR